MTKKKYNCNICQDRGSIPSMDGPWIPSMDGPWSDMCVCRIAKKDLNKKYFVVCYMKVRAEDIELMTIAQARVEAEQARLMQPENIYRIESIDDEYDVVP